MRYRLLIWSLVVASIAGCHSSSEPSTSGEQPRVRAEHVPETEAQAAASQNDLQQIQGTWEIVAAEQGGNDVTKQCQQRIPTITIKDNAWLQEIDGHPLYVAENSRLVLDADATPKQFDHMLKKIENGQTMTLTYPGIYELDGDQLKLCWDTMLKERPKKFGSQSGETFFFVTYKRAKSPPAQ